MNSVEIWTCEACGREFGKHRQAHVCAPAMPIDAYFDGRPAADREVFEAVRGHLESLGPVIVEPVGVGILFKRRRTFVELRPRARGGFSLSVGLNRRLVHPRVSRTTRTKTASTYHGINVAVPADIDVELRQWLTESYFEFAE